MNTNKDKPETVVDRPADEQAAAHASVLGGREDPWRHTHDAVDRSDEKKKAKPTDSKDTPVVDPDAGVAPAGYDAAGQPLRTEEERRNAGVTPEKRLELDDKLTDIERKAKAESDKAKKDLEDSTYKPVKK